MPPHPAIASTAEIVAEIKAGRMVILVDEEDRENEGDLVMAAEHVTAEAINFMAKFGRGLVCLTLTEARCKKLGLVQMARNNKAQYGTAFTVSIEAAEGVTTGISAADRARTIQVAVAKLSTADDIVQPGHIFPITAREGGVLVRAGHTEAGCDLAGMAGLEPSAAICEIMNDDGTMARLPELMEFTTVPPRKRWSSASSAKPSPPPTVILRCTPMSTAPAEQPIWHWSKGKSRRVKKRWSASMNRSRCSTSSTPAANSNPFPSTKRRLRWPKKATASSS